MIKFRKFIIVLLMVAVGLGIGYGGIKVVNNKVKADEQLDLDHDPKTLKDIAGIDIKECKDTPKITKDQAIEIAIKNGAPSDRAKKIHAQYCLFSNLGFMIQPTEKIVKDNPLLQGKNNLDSIPVWIISFRGMNNVKGNQIRTEMNFVIDATSGDVIYAFAYR